MICQKCGREAGPEAKFCVDCGSPLVLRCPACQTPYDLGSRFCSLCGRSLPEAVTFTLEETPETPELHEPLQETQQVDPPPQFEVSVQSGSLSHPCPRCSQHNASNAEYCFACGMPLEIPADIATSSTTSANMSSEEPAGFFGRLIAYLIDNVLAVACASLAVGSFASPGDFRDFDSAFVGSLLIFLVVWVGYFTSLIAIRATTVGKSFLGLYVVRSDGSRVGLGRAFFRSLTLLLILTVAYVTVIGVFLLIIPYVRTLHDRIWDTMVVQRRRQMS